MVAVCSVTSASCVRLCPHPETAWRQRLAEVSERQRLALRFGYHLDGVAGALFETRCAARAEVHVDVVTVPGAEAGDRLFWAGRVAIVAFETVATRKAAL